MVSVTGSMRVNSTMVILPLALPEGSWTLCYFMKATGWRSPSSNLGARTITVPPATTSAPATIVLPATQPLVLHEYGYMLPAGGKYAVARGECGSTNWKGAHESSAVAPGRYNLCYQNDSPAVVAYVVVKGVCPCARRGMLIGLEES